MSAHPAPARTAWLRTEKGVAIVCAWCADAQVAEARAQAAGLRVSHGICPECAAAKLGKELTPVSFAPLVPFTDARSGAPITPYVTAREVARVCGLSEFALDTRYRPEHWGSPRDFKLTAAGVLCYAQDRLEELAAALLYRGQPEAARRLREWAELMGRGATPAPAKTLTQGSSEDTGFHSPGSAGPTPAPASNPREPESWAHKWERENDL